MAGVGGTNYGTLRQRQGSVASLASANPVLAYGEFTMTYDGAAPILKIGDGSRQWLDLPNLAGGGGGGSSAPAVSAVEAYRTGPSGTLIQTEVTGSTLPHYKAEMPSGFSTYDPYDGYDGYEPSDLSWITPATDGAYFTIEQPCWYSFGGSAYVRWTDDPSWATFSGLSNSGFGAAQQFAHSKPQQSQYVGAGTDYVFHSSVQTGPLLSAGGEIVEFNLEWGDVAAANLTISANFTLLQRI